MPPVFRAVLMITSDKTLGDCVLIQKYEMPFKDTCLLSFQAMQKSRSTIEDFCLSYFPLHGLQLPEDFLKYLDVLCFVEAAIYSIDDENEQMALAGCARADHVFQGEAVIRGILEELDILTFNVELQLLQGRSYWQKERMICSCLGKQATEARIKGFTLDTLHAASEGKSFDYRLLNHLLFALRGVEPDRDLLQFLFVDEHLVDIGDDLLDYEEQLAEPFFASISVRSETRNAVQDDIAKNSFNIYRGYVYLFGSNAPLMLVRCSDIASHASRISSFETRHRQFLAALPDSTQEAYATRRKKASSVPGSEKWVFPQPILDESKFRRNLAE